MLSRGGGALLWRSSVGVGGRRGKKTEPPEGEKSYVKTREKIVKGVVTVVGDNYQLDEEGVLVANNATKNKVGMRRQWHSLETQMRYLKSKGRALDTVVCASIAF